MDIIALIITFHPRKELLLNNIEAIYHDVDSIIIWQNSNEDFDYLNHFTKIAFWGDKTNHYIAEPINEVIRYCYENSIDFLLTLDQDTVFHGFGLFKNAVEKSISADVAVYAPVLHWFKRSSNEPITETKTAITSGSILNIKIARELGGYREDYKIYEADLEYCHWARKNGYRILNFWDFVLNHNLGYQSKPIWKFSVWNYSPIVYYFIFRNRCWMYREYFDKRDLLKMLKSSLILYVPGIILGERNKIKKIYYLGKGLSEGLFSPISTRPFL